MRLLKYLAVLVAVATLVCSCGAAKSSTQEIGDLAAERIISGDENPNFQTVFGEGTAAFDQAVADRESYFFGILDSFIKGLGADWTEAQSETLSEDIKNLAREKAQVRLQSAETAEDGRLKLTYTVTGLDFATVLAQAAQTIYDASEADPALKYDSAALSETAANAFAGALRTEASAEEPVETVLVLEKIQGQWQLPENQPNNVDDLMLAAFFGAESESDFLKDIQSAKLGVWRE